MLAPTVLLQNPEHVIPKTTHIWDYTKVMRTAQIGHYVTIGSFCEIAGKIGNGCRIQNGVYIWAGIELGENVFVGPNVAFTNVKLPKVGVTQKFSKTIVGEGTVIGANATIICGVTIGKDCVIGAGSVVTHNVLDGQTVYGNPARPRMLTNPKTSYYDPRDPDEIAMEMDRGNL